MSTVIGNGGFAEESAIEAYGLGKRYRRGWALKDCSFRLPAGRICGLVGPNGAGKTTLMGTAVNLLKPTTGTVRVFGAAPGSEEANRRTAFLAQEKPLFRRFTVAEILRLGRELNPRWDQKTAEEIVRSGNVPFTARIGTLSGGQRTRVAFALAFGRRPDLLILDEPMSDLDPLVRHELMSVLMAEAAEHGTTVLMSTHMLADLENICDYLIVIASGGVRLAGEVEDLLTAHTLLTGAHTGEGVPQDLARHTVVESRVSGRQVTALVRPDGPVAGTWQACTPNLEEILLAYLRSPDTPPLISPSAQVDPKAAAA
ncbi:ABC transporter ATP-binding protein [Streptomyces lunaelactis]|uniref:ABC transporter ATP-binding protein n=1 Tax=Streptomyces lunaelactis TaxID=1535768 RepID=A0A2R4T163_9ACTN|nr:ABC transporter ATP-binding protein [Streptomyces lunaelactis]AVZ72852.1 ABC transporter ATP-binding protein [Streptomyces lunaelactis]NUK89095.1 ABC transporter ATP-binding protein [Streptomyces lunaelactis]